MEKQGLPTPAAGEDRVVSPSTCVFQCVSNVYVCDCFAVTLDAESFCDQLTQLRELFFLDHQVVSSSFSRLRQLVLLLTVRAIFLELGRARARPAPRIRRNHNAPAHQRSLLRGRADAQVRVERLIRFRRGDNRSPPPHRNFAASNVVVKWDAAPVTHRQILGAR